MEFPDGVGLFQQDISVVPNPHQ